MYRTCALIAVFAALLATPSAGQDKPVASESAPAPQDEQGFVDKAKDWGERTQIIDRLNGDVDGWHPRLGGMTRGGGFAIGPGYRFHAGTTLVDLSAGISTKAYKAVDAKVRWIN